MLPKKADYIIALIKLHDCENVGPQFTYLTIVMVVLQMLVSLIISLFLACQCFFLQNIISWSLMNTAYIRTRSPLLNTAKSNLWEIVKGSTIESRSEKNRGERQKPLLKPKPYAYSRILQMCGSTGKDVSVLLAALLNNFSNIKHTLQNSSGRDSWP